MAFNPQSAPGTATQAVAARAGQPGSGTHLDAAGNVVSDADGSILVYADGTTPNDHLDPATRAQWQAESAKDPTGDFVTNLATRDNPIAGTVRAGVDAAQGNYGAAISDFGAGTSYGTLPRLDANGNVIPGDTVGSLVPGVNPGSFSTAGKAIAGAGKALVNTVGGALAPATADPSGLEAVRDRAFRTQDALTGRIQGLEQNPTVAPQSDLVQLDQTNIDPLRQRQTTSLDLLQDAATGRVPSAAEILGRDQANRAAAQAYGAAAALQGGNSSGGTLRQALDAQQQIQGDANTQLMAARAKEMSDARAQLVQGAAAARGQESADATTGANLAQNRNLANTQAAVTTHGQDVSQMGDLVSGQNTALATGAGAEKAKVDADTANAASANALKGAEIGGAASAIPGLVKAISDRRAKKDIHSADLVQLAEDAPGYTFEYKDSRNGPGLRVGVMAQDLKKSPLGEQLVRLGNGGQLELDGANALGAAVAMSAEALRKAEAARKRR
jgi:hypothetical protein